MLKKTFDFLLALIVFIPALPVIAVISVLILISMGKPIFFRQKREGKDCVPFYIYKFRTMTNETNENGELLPDELRLKGIGKFIRSTSLDELPQLFNIIRGEMSFVGPRPLYVDYTPLYNERQKLRLSVIPGITGWAQVNGRNAISWEKKFELDAWYVENRSFFLDMKILVMTFLKVIRRSDINSDTYVTMERFKGSHDK